MSPLNGFLEGTPGSTLVSLPVCVASTFTLGIPSVPRPDVWDTPEASTLVGYLNGGCPWCVHFIYDEYYMANLLSVLNSSWENVTREGLGRRPSRVRKWIVSAWYVARAARPRAPGGNADLLGDRRFPPFLEDPLGRKRAGRPLLKEESSWV